MHQKSDKSYPEFNREQQEWLKGISEKWEKYLRRIARTYLQDEDVISTIIQDALLKLGLLHDRTLTESYIKAILCNRVQWDCISYLNKSSTKRKNQILSLDAFNEIGAELAIWDPEEERLEKEWAQSEEIKMQLLHKALKDLPFRERTVISLWLEGFSYKQIADEMQLSYQQIKRLEIKGIRLLKQKVAILRPAVPGAISFQVRMDEEIRLTKLQLSILRVFEQTGCIHEVSRRLNISLTKISKEQLDIQRQLLIGRKRRLRNKRK